MRKKKTKKVKLSRPSRTRTQMKRAVRTTPMTKQKVAKKSLQKDPTAVKRSAKRVRNQLEARLLNCVNKSAWVSVNKSLLLAKAFSARDRFNKLD